MRSLREHSSAGSAVVQRKEAPASPGPGKQSAIHNAFPPVQRKASGTEGLSDEETHEAAQAGVSGPGGALPHGDRIQAAFGRHDVSGIKAHVGGDAAGASKAIGAQAYATGNNVAFQSAPDLHTAAHEAAHVVQQRAGVHLKGGVGAEGDSHEQHADAVADAVVQGKSAESLLDNYSGGGGGGAAVQRRAVAAGELHGAQADGSDSIFDSKLVKTGLKFKLSAQIAAPDYNKVIAKYHELIRPIGNAMASHEFTDKKTNFQNGMPGNKSKWTKDYAADFVAKGRAQLAMKDSPTDFEYWTTLCTAAKAGPLLNRPEVGLVDPFVLEVEIKDSAAPAKPPWLVVTQFANSGVGYIKKVFNGAQQFGGDIATSEQMSADKDKAAGSKTDFKYSSTHEQGGDSFDQRIAGLDPTKGKVGENAAGLDAVTWVAAEGARFAPVAALGGAGSPESRYFIKPNPANWIGYKFFTAMDLVRTWKDSFKKAYNVSSAEVATVVSSKGKTDEAQPPKGVHFNLTTGARYDQR